MKSIIITGATSMIGSAIVSEALSEGRRVAAVIRENSPQISNLRSMNNSQKLEIIECGIENYSSLKFSRKYDAFIHLAWQSTELNRRDDMRSQTLNIMYTADAVHAASRAGCEVFIGAGSQAEYGATSEKLNGNTPCNPESGYGIAKYAAGKLAFLEASNLGMRACHTRILSTYGEGMSDKTLIVYLIKALLAGEKPSLTKCEQIWDYMHVSDTSRAFLAISEHGIDGNTYPIGSGIGASLRSYIEALRDIINPSLKLGFGEKEYYPHQPMYICADISELTRDTGFRPTVSFDEGIRKTINWVKDCKE